MKFPELKIIDKVKNEDQNRDAVKELLIVQLDWSELDNHKIKSRKDWYQKHGLSKPTKEQSIALNQMLDGIDWSEYLYPQKYKFIFDKYSQFKITQSYYDECLHLRKMATDEWNRPRPFDTNVREHLLNGATNFVDLFFYMIGDAIYIYNPELHLKSPKQGVSSMSNDEAYFEHSVLLRSIMLFRFWKFQTGGGLLVDKSSEFIKRYNDSIRERFSREIKPYLIDNVEFEPFGLSRHYPEKEKQLLLLVSQRVRHNRLNNILN
jgi:hypothetical protein